MLRRLDYMRNEFVGSKLMEEFDSITATAQTESEDHKAGDFSVTAKGIDVWVENKTVNISFEHDTKDRLDPWKNNNWFYKPTLKEGHRYWMLNAVDYGNLKGKFFECVENGVALAYLFRDGILYFKPSALLEADAGIGIYRCSQRTEFEAEKRKPSYQAKMIIDLEKGKWIPCEVPKELFDFSTHEDFNKNNAGKDYIS